MDELISIIANVGFPVAVAIYLLVRLESKLDLLSNTINDLTIALIKHTDEK